MTITFNNRNGCMLCDQSGHTANTTYILIAILPHNLNAMKPQPKRAVGE
jgi:hypothetical protein